MDATNILKKIRKIEITTKNLVNEMFSGEYHSLFKGQGLEFSEVREYQIGDSFRQIDWNVTARMRHPYIKKFEETRELNVIFLVDASASTIFGTKNSLKSEYITEITAVLSFSALSNNDKVGLALFTDEVEKYLPSRKGSKYVLRILRDILYFEPKHKNTNIAKAIEYIYRLTKKRSIIFIISDFDDSSNFMDPLKLLAKRHDVIAIRVKDNAELFIPDTGLVYFKDPETGKSVAINTSDRKFISKYINAIKRQDDQLKEKFKRNAIDFLDLRTDQNYVKELLKFFKYRIKMKNQR
jgi:uncharacterized protein (DUF58 family)